MNICESYFFLKFKIRLLRLSQKVKKCNAKNDCIEKCATRIYLKKKLQSTTNLYSH